MASDEVPRMSEGKAPRFAIYDLQSGRPYVMVVYPTEEQARLDLRDLLKPYPEDSPWRERLGVRDTAGCGARGKNRLKCNLATGHKGPHADVVWITSKGGRQSTIWFDKPGPVAERKDES